MPEMFNKWLLKERKKDRFQNDRGVLKGENWLMSQNSTASKKEIQISLVLLGLKKKNNLLKIKSEYCFYCPSPSTCPKHVHIKFSQKFLPSSFPRMASLRRMTGSGTRLHMLPAPLSHRERLTITSLLSQLQENQNANS